MVGASQCSAPLSSGCLRIICEVMSVPHSAVLPLLLNLLHLQQTASQVRDIAKAMAATSECCHYDRISNNTVNCICIPTSAYRLLCCSYPMLNMNQIGFKYGCIATGRIDVMLRCGLLFIAACRPIQEMLQCISGMFAMLRYEAHLHSAKIV